MYAECKKPAATTVRSHVVEVFMAGDVDHAKQAIRRFCMDNPSCVTVTPTTYIYRGGEEGGFVVGFRNYPRFPATADELRRKAQSLKDVLIKELSQDSAMIVEHDGQTEWTTRRTT